jgi:hypothetical protein
MLRTNTGYHVVVSSLVLPICGSDVPSRGRDTGRYLAALKAASSLF